MTEHPFEPVFNKSSELLILGSFPSVKSRREGFYYGNPQNRFWKVLAMVYACKEPQGVGEKTDFLIRHRIALWDVVGSCEVVGSADASIREASANDLSRLLNAARIGGIYTNGKTAYALYKRLQEPVIGIPAVCLPSTSPANAAWSLDRLVSVWKCIASVGVTKEPTIIKSTPNQQKID